ncbi:MAG: cupin domain-containing protein [Rubripirellula sp.]
MITSNLFKNTESVDGDEFTEVLATRRGVRVERIVSHGHSSPDHFWYDQDEDEWVVVLQGQAVLEFDSGEFTPLAPGDHCMIPAHRRHRVESTSEEQPTIWLAIFFSS